MHGTCVTCRARLRVESGPGSGALVECPACREVMLLQGDALAVATPEEAADGIRIMAVQQDMEPASADAADETIVLAADTGTKEKGAWLLRLENGERAGEIVPLAVGTTIVGRTEGDITLPEDAEASRKHAAFDVYGLQRMVVRDLASSNGTFVNGRKVAQVEIRHGDVVRFGRTEATLLASGQLAGSS